MPKISAYLDLEKGLKAKLKSKMDKHIKAKAAKIGGRLSRGNIPGALEVVNTIDMSVCYVGMNKYLRQHATMTMLLGSSGLTPVKETQIYRSKRLPDEGKLIIVQLKKMLDDSTKRLRKKASIIIDKFEQEAKDIDFGKLEKADPIIKEITEAQLISEGDNVLDLSASLQSSRLAAMGHVIEAEALGVTTYRISEQLDRRTCPVCSVMHGKEFSIVEARGKLDAAISTDDPAELKQVSPWPKQDANSVADLRNMSSEQLVSSGFQTPPYHPMCRGQLVVTSAVEPLSPAVLDDILNNPEASPFNIPVTLEDQLDALTAQEAAEELKAKIDGVFEDSAKYVLDNGEKYADDAIEFAATFDDLGNPLIAKKGVAHGVSFTEDEMDALKAAKNPTLVHNHPSNYSLSKEDLGFAELIDGTVVAVTKNGRKYTVVVHEWDMANSEYKTISDAVMVHIDKGLYSGKLNIDTANELHAHLVNSVLDESGYITYNATGLPGAYKSYTDTVVTAVISDLY